MLSAQFNGKLYLENDATIKACSQICTNSTTINFRTFLSPPKMTPHALAITPISLDSQLLILCSNRFFSSLHCVTFVPEFFHSVFKVHPCGGICQCFIPFGNTIIFHRMGVPQLALHSSTDAFVLFCFEHSLSARQCLRRFT